MVLCVRNHLDLIRLGFRSIIKFMGNDRKSKKAQSKKEVSESEEYSYYTDSYSESEPEPSDEPSDHKEQKKTKKLLKAPTLSEFLESYVFEVNAKAKLNDLQVLNKQILVWKEHRTSIGVSVVLIQMFLSNIVISKPKTDKDPHYTQLISQMYKYRNDADVIDRIASNIYKQEFGPTSTAEDQLPFVRQCVTCLINAYGVSEEELSAFIALPEIKRVANVSDFAGYIQHCINPSVKKGKAKAVTKAKAEPKKKAITTKKATPKKRAEAGG